MEDCSLNTPEQLFSSWEHIADYVSTNNLLGVIHTQRIFLQTLKDYFDRKVIDLEKVADIANVLFYVFNDWEKIYKEDQELGGVLHDASEINFPDRTPEMDQRIETTLREYYQIHS